MIGFCLLFVAELLTSRATAENGCLGDCTSDAACNRPIIVHGEAVALDGSTKATFHPGERMRVVCDDDYVIQGDQVARCNDELTWSWSVKPRCVSKPPPPPLCTAPKVMAEGMYVNRTEKALGGVYSRLYVECYVDDDYDLHGPGVYTCEGTIWKGNNTCVKRRVCPRITVPTNGFIVDGDVDSRNERDSWVAVECKPGYSLMGRQGYFSLWGGQAWFRCELTLRWSGKNVLCEKDLHGITGLATAIADEGLLSASNRFGTDLFFVVDRSDSTSKYDLQMALEIINTLLDFVVLSSKGGATRLSVFSYGAEAKLDLTFDMMQKMEECLIRAKQDGENIQDYYAAWAEKCLYVTAAPLGSFMPNCTGVIPENTPAGVNKTEIAMALKQLVKRKIRFIQSSGDSTNIGMYDALAFVRRIPSRCDLNKALFLMSDGRNEILDSRHLDAIVHGFRRRSGEVFVIGIGHPTDQFEALASLPHGRHIFRLRDFQELAGLKRLVTQCNCGACGISNIQKEGDVVLNESIVQEAKQRSWPWLVKISVNQGRFRCAGALVAKNYVLTAASCLYDDNGILLLSGGPGSTLGIFVMAGFFDVHDMTGWQTSVAEEIKIYPGFNITRPWEKDVALIRLRNDVKLTQYVRTLCLPGTTDSILLQTVKTRWLVGWNTSTAEPLATMTARPWERTMELHGKRECSREHPYTASQSYLQCMGDRHQKRGYCAGDKGAPIVVPDRDTYNKPIYKVVALVEDGSECMRPGKFTVVTQLTAAFTSWITSNIQEDDRSN